MAKEDGNRRRRIEHAVAACARRQHGVVTRPQLLAAGMSPDTVHRWLTATRLTALHRGVYQVGPVALPHTRVVAAVLACGPAAVVSHSSAAALWQLIQIRGRMPLIDISVERGERRRPGIRLHRVRAFTADEVTKLEGIPVTTPARTLVDIAHALTDRALERALIEALGSHRVGRAELLAVLARHEGRPGLRRLRALVQMDHVGLTRSKAEDRFLALIRKALLPVPEVNVEVAGNRVDFFWRAERFVVEIDGFAYHSTSGRFEKDRERDASLVAEGVRVTRVTWRQLVKEPEAVIVRLALGLHAAGP